MSAYTVSPIHIATLVDWYARAEPGRSTDREALALLLAVANVESVCARYSDMNRDDAARMAGVADEVEYLNLAKLGAVRMALSMPKVTNPVHIIKMCDGLDYQCCEVDDWNWRENEACRMIERIKCAAIRRLPGYDESPYWHYDGEARKNLAVR